MKDARLQNTVTSESTPSIPFSVSMCVYEKDNPEHFKIAVESILNQTVEPSEVVLVVDGPVTEEIDCVIRAFEDNPIFVVERLPVNQGHGNARRIGLQRCSNSIVALMDADDISSPNRFELQLAVFGTEPNVSVVGGNITEFVGEPNNIVAARNVPKTDAEIKVYMKTRCPMNQVTVMFKKADVEAVGGYVDWYCEEDYYLWLRLMLGGYGFANVTSPLVNVRVGQDMYQRRGGWKYFKSEARLQKFMLDKKINGIASYAVNTLKRFIVQVCLPNSLRGWVFKTFAREKTK